MGSSPCPNECFSRSDNKILDNLMNYNNNNKKEEKEDTATDPCDNDDHGDDNYVLDIHSPPSLLLDLDDNDADDHDTNTHGENEEDGDSELYDDLVDTTTDNTDFVINVDDNDDHDHDEEEEDETSFLMNTDDATNYGTDRDDNNDNSIHDNDGSFDDDWLRIKGSSRTLMSDEYKEYNSNYNNDDDNHPTNTHTNTNTNNTNNPTSTKNDKDTKIQEDSFLRSLMTGGDNDNDIDNNNTEDKNNDHSCRPIIPVSSMSMPMSLDFEKNPKELII